MSCLSTVDHTLQVTPKNEEQLIREKFDIAIIGGGLSGLTLALQLKQSNALLSVVILEKRAQKADNITHKVGESLVELAAHYLKKELGLADYLEEHHAPKFGFRFFLNTPFKDKIDSRIEVDSFGEMQLSSHHLDRGKIENDLVRKLIDVDVKVLSGASVKSIDLMADGHQLEYLIDNEKKGVSCSWLIDASGRSSLLKRKLKLQQKIAHDVNAAWFRIDKVLDVRDWSDNSNWQSEVSGNFRRESTIHLVGDGYWVWIISLPGDHTSVGVVAKNSIHDFSILNTREKTLEWLAKYEPLAWDNIYPFQEKIVDFKVMKEFAHDCKQFFSSDRWVITGEASTFLDPFYSPGNDFIALSNTWITDLVSRDFKGENIDLRVKVYENTQRKLVDGWFSLYRNLYTLLANPQVMLAKIIWDWSTYWSVLTPLYVNKGYTSLKVLKAYSSKSDDLGKRFDALNRQLQKLLVAWESGDSDCYLPDHINTFSFDFLYNFHLQLKDELDEESLIKRISINVGKLEDIAGELFRIAFNIKYHTSYQGPINPYLMDLDMPNISTFNTFRSANIQIKKDLNLIRLSPDRDETVARFKSIEHVFETTTEVVVQLGNLTDIMLYLDSFDSLFKPIAVEAASFAIALNELKLSGELTQWKEFDANLTNLLKPYSGIGLGWAFAKSNVDPLKDETVKSNDVLKELVINGAGYYLALYNQRKTLFDFRIWNYCPHELKSSYDQGIGRRLWYREKGNLKLIEIMINKFSESRRKDLWNGVGLACGVVGSVSEYQIKEVKNLQIENQLFFRSGMIYTSIFNLIGNRNENETVRNCDLLFSLNLKDLLGLSSRINSHNIFGITAQLNFLEKLLSKESKKINVIY